MKTATQTTLANAPADIEPVGEPHTEGVQTDVQMQPPGAASEVVEDAAQHPDEQATASAKPPTTIDNPLVNPILVRVADLKPHPQAHLVPTMPEEQWLRFLPHIKEHGVRDAVLITKDNVIIDGRSRWQAARENGLETIPAVVVELDETRQQIHMLEAALRRRHLTDDQRAAAEEKLRKLTEPQRRHDQAHKAGKAGGRGRGKSSDSLQDDVSSELSTATDAGNGAGDTKKSNTSIPDRKRKAARLVDKASPEMTSRVIAGDITLNAAKRELREDGKLPPAKTPKLGRKTAELATGMMAPPAATPGRSSVPDHLPFESAADLADMLVAALGAEKALQFLHAAISAVGVQRHRQPGQAPNGTSGGPPADPSEPELPTVTLTEEPVGTPT